METKQKNNGRFIVVIVINILVGILSFIPAIFTSNNDLREFKNIIFIIIIILLPQICIYFIFRRTESKEEKRRVMNKKETKECYKNSIQDKISSIDICIVAINDYIMTNIDIFKEELSVLIIFLKNFIKKDVYIKNIIKLQFCSSELIYLKILEILKSNEKEVIINIEKILCILWNIDEEEDIKNKIIQKNSKEDAGITIERKKKSIFNSYKKLILNIINLIDDINIKIEELQVEVVKLLFNRQSSEDKANIIEFLDEIKSKMKYYK